MTLRNKRNRRVAGGLDREGTGCRIIGKNGKMNKSKDQENQVQEAAVPASTPLPAPITTAAGGGKQHDNTQ